MPYYSGDRKRHPNLETYPHDDSSLIWPAAEDAVWDRRALVVNDASERLQVARRSEAKGWARADRVSGAVG